MRNFCIAILLYVITSNLDVLISFDVICRSNVNYFCCKNMNSDETINMHVPQCVISSIRLMYGFVAYYGIALPL